MILIYYKTWIYQCLFKQVKSPSTWSRVPNSVRIRHLGWAENRGVTVYAYSPLTTFLWCYYHIGQSFRVLDFYDEPRFQKVIYFSLNNLMSVWVATPYSLSDRPSRQDNIHPMRSMRGVNASHVRVGPSEYINITKQDLPQSFFLFPRQEGADISVLIRTAQGY